MTIGTLKARSVRLARYLEEQKSHCAAMVMDDGDASLWAQTESEKLADHLATVRELWALAKDRVE
jgi:hypothetical protein